MLSQIQCLDLIQKPKKILKEPPKCCSSCLRLTQKFLKRNKLHFKNLKEKFNNEKYKGLDFLTVEFIPLLKNKVDFYYENNGLSMLDEFSKDEIEYFDKLMVYRLKRYLEID